MYVIGSLPDGVDDEVAQGAAAAEGVVAVPLSPFGYEPGQPSGLLLGFSAYDGRQIREGVRRLAAALRKLRPGAKG
jgi:DNA-binding transcriptional MocR family regulator